MWWNGSLSICLSSDCLSVCLSVCLSIYLNHHMKQTHLLAEVSVMNSKLHNSASLFSQPPHLAHLP